MGESRKRNIFPSHFLEGGSSGDSGAKSTVLYPQLESTTAPLDPDTKYNEMIMIEKDLVNCLQNASKSNPLEYIVDTSILPMELLQETRKVPKQKIDLINRIKELPTDEAEDEEEPENEEEEDEEQAALEDEEEDAGGDYMMSHFDNGEGFEDNDDEGDEAYDN